MPRGYYFTIEYDRDGWRARFWYNDELIWWTEGYASPHNSPANTGVPYPPGFP